MKGLLKDLLAMTLPHRAFAASAAFVAGLAQGGGFSLETAALGVASIISIYSSQAIFNNIRDIEGDRINAPDRPLARGSISLPAAWAMMLFFSALGFALAYLAAPALAGVAFLYVLFGIIYSAYTKSRWYLSYATLTVTHYVIPFGSAYLLTGAPDARFFAIVGFIAATEVLAISLKDYKDVKGDLKVGMRTLPLTFSLDNAAKITFAGLCLPLLLVWLPWSALNLSLAFLGIYLFAGAIRYSLGLELLRDPSPQAAGRILKIFRYVVLLQLFGWCLR